MRAQSRPTLRRAAAALALWVALVVAATTAVAAPRRFAIVVGNNAGHGADTPLVYAERDASRVAALLRELGRFEDVSLLLGRDASTVLAAVAAMQERAARTRAAGDEVVFVFFYSGHGSHEGLRLGASELAHAALLAGVRAIPADVRVVIVDACEAGVLTRGKGLRAGPPVSVSLDDTLGTTGEAILASTSQSEAAQESEVLKGGFFTSHLLSGLRGAADRDGDGVVGLREAYEYASARTVSSTVVSAAGLQRPTYAVRLRGTRDVPLAWPGQSRAFLQFRARSSGSFLVLSQDEQMVLAEVAPAGGNAQRIALVPGSYWIKKRGTGGVLMARVRLEPGSDAVLDESQMAQIPYATLAQRGSRPPGLLTVSAGLASPIGNVDSDLPVSLELGYVVNYDRFGAWWSVALSGAHSSVLDSTLLEVRPQLALLWRAPHPRWELFYGPAVSLPLYMQFVMEERRDVLGLGLDGIAGVSFWTTERVALTSQLQLGVRVIEREGADESGVTPNLYAGLSMGARLRF